MADLRRTPRLAAEPTPPAPARPGPSTPPTGPAPHPSPPGAVTAQGSRHGTSTPGGHPSPSLPFSGPPEAAGNLSPVTAPEAAPGASGAGRGQAQPPSPVSPVRASGASAELRDRGRATRAGTVTGGPLVRQAEGAVPAGPKPLRGAEWRQAVKDAQSGRAKAQRRKPAGPPRPAGSPLPRPSSRLRDLSPRSPLQRPAAHASGPLGLGMPVRWTGLRRSTSGRGTQPPRSPSRWGWRSDDLTAVALFAGTADSTGASGPGPMSGQRWRSTPSAAACSPATSRRRHCSVT